MGLDMYLYKETYVQNWDFYPAEQQHNITVKIGDKVRNDINPKRITHITERVAYWRKFNALHNWFVENCGGGIDECQRIHVPDEKLVELIETLKEVKKVLDKSKKTTKVVKGWDDKDYDVSTYECEDAIENLLPTKSGFFFGSTEVDDDYKSDVENTIKVLEGIFEEQRTSEKIPNAHSGDFYYRASW